MKNMSKMEDFKEYLENPNSERNKRRMKRLYRSELSDRPYAKGYTDAKFWG